MQSVMARAYVEQMRAAAIRDAALRAARSETYRATTQLYSSRIRLEKEFRLSSEMSLAESRLKDAQHELEAAHESVLTRLRNQSDYQAAARAKDDAISRIESFKNLSTDSPIWLEAVANRTTAASAVSRIEVAAFKEDAAVQEAERRASAALQEVQSKRRQFEASISSNPAIAAASGDVLQARKQMAAAYAAGNASLAAAGRGRPSSRSRPGR